MAVHSMTAFARHFAEGAWGSANWELRSVNHRYLDVSFRLPPVLNDLEMALRERLRGALARGKVECRLQYQPGEGCHTEFTLNEPLIRELVKGHKKITSYFDVVTPVKTFDLLRWPGVVADHATLDEDASSHILASFDAALVTLQTHRAREGAALAQTIEQRLEDIAKQVTQIEKRLPELQVSMKEKLHTRYRELELEGDESRLAQELALLLQKSDVEEEIDRLRTHIDATREALAGGGSMGRRLDFLMQEMNREANTLSSKSLDHTLTQCAIHCKVLVEQIREQVQNIE